jgi:hypothetical protein
MDVGVRHECNRHPQDSVPMPLDDDFGKQKLNEKKI